MKAEIFTRPAAARATEEGVSDAASRRSQYHYEAKCPPKVEVTQFEESSVSRPRTQHFIRSISRRPETVKGPRRYSRLDARRQAMNERGTVQESKPVTVASRGSLFSGVKWSRIIRRWGNSAPECSRGSCKSLHTGAAANSNIAA